MLSLLLAFGLSATAIVQTQEAAAPMSMERAKSPEWFEEKIRPLLAARCFECHTDDKSGGLRLDSREAMILGGESGSAIEPGTPEESLLIKAVQRAPKVPAMPKKAAKLKQDEIDDLVAWVRAGAPWPKSSAAALPAGESKGSAPIPAKSIIT